MWWFSWTLTCKNKLVKRYFKSIAFFSLSPSEISLKASSVISLLYSSSATYLILHPFRLSCNYSFSIELVSKTSSTKALSINSSWIIFYTSTNCGGFDEVLLVKIIVQSYFKWTPITFWKFSITLTTSSITFTNFHNCHNLLLHHLYYLFHHLHYPFNHHHLHS